MSNTVIKVGVSPLTNRIYAGKVNLNMMWKEKKDVTDEAVGAVAEHLLRADETFQFDYKGKTYHLKVTEQP